MRKLSLIFLILGMGYIANLLILQMFYPEADLNFKKGVGFVTGWYVPLSLALYFWARARNKWVERLLSAITNGIMLYAWIYCFHTKFTLPGIRITDSYGLPNVLTDVLLATAVFFVFSFPIFWILGALTGFWIVVILTEITADRESLGYHFYNLFSYHNAQTAVWNYFVLMLILAYLFRYKLARRLSQGPDGYSGRSYNNSYDHRNDDEESDRRRRGEEEDSARRRRDEEEWERRRREEEDEESDRRRHDQEEARRREEEEDDLRREEERQNNDYGMPWYARKKED